MGKRANKVEAAKAALIKKATEVRSKALVADAQAEQVSVTRYVVISGERTSDGVSSGVGSVGREFTASWPADISSGTFMWVNEQRRGERAVSGIGVHAELEASNTNRSMLTIRVCVRGPQEGKDR